MFVVYYIFFFLYCKSLRQYSIGLFMILFPSFYKLVVVLYGWFQRRIRAVNEGNISFMSFLVTPTLSTVELYIICCFFCFTFVIVFCFCLSNEIKAITFMVITPSNTILTELHIKCWAVYSHLTESFYYKFSPFSDPFIVKEN